MSTSPQPSFSVEEVIAACREAMVSLPCYQHDFIRLTEGPANMSADDATAALQLGLPRMAQEAAAASRSLEESVLHFVADVELLAQLHQQYE